MQFSTAILAALTISSSVFAAPAAKTSNFEKRASVATIIGNALSAVERTTEEDTYALSQGILAAVGDVTAQISIIASVNANINAIVQSLTGATATIVASTVNGGTSLLGPEVELLTTDIGIAAGLVASLSTSLSGLKGFVTLTKAVLTSEVAVLDAAVSAAIAPLITYGKGVVAASKNASTADINALSASIANLIATQNAFITL